MKQILIMLAITAFAYTNAEAQGKCAATPPKHSTAVKHKSARHTSTRTTTATMACRMLPYQVCKILPDRRSVSCYATIDSDHQTQSGPAKIYGPTGPMPGEVVHFKVRTVVIKGKDQGAFCKRNKEDNATICSQPGILLRDENGYYSYGEPLPKKVGRRITAR
jgi:hypothetical protein